MRHRVLLALVVSISGTACEIPGRINPLDPANLPDPAIEIYENLVGGEPIVEASFTESVFLAAGKSEPPGHDLRVRWSVELPSGEQFDVNGGTEYRIADDPRVPFRFNTVLPSEEIRDSGRLGVTVIARVRDADTGGTAEARRFFQLLNSAPVIATPRYVEITPGGRWWKDPGPERQIVTVLDAFASDPDLGDSVQVEWKQIGGRTVANLPDNQDVRIDVPLWEQTVSFRAHATDLAGAETIADVLVVVQDVVWTADGSGVVRRAQEPPISVTPPSLRDGWTLGVATTGLGETVVWTVERDLTGNWIVVRHTPEVALTGTSSFDTGIDAYTEELRGGAFTNNGGVVWLGLGDTILAFADTAVVAAPALTATNRTLVTLSADGITAPHALAPVTGSATGDAWALLDEAGTPTVRRVSVSTGVSATSTAIPGAVAIEPAKDGGAWVLVSDPESAAVTPSIVRLDATGAIAGPPIDLPFPAVAQARVFSVRAPIHPSESLRVAVGGGSASANSFLALIEARDAVTGAPSDGIAGDPALMVTFRFQEAPVSDVALDPQDGGAWALVPSTGRVRKYFFDGTVVRSAGDLTFLPLAVPPPLKADVRTGHAWIADHSGALRGIPGAPIVPYPDSAVLSSPDRLQLDPVRNRLAGAGKADLSVVVASGSEVERQIFLPDIGHTGGPVGVTFDPENGCVWFASESRLTRQICRDGVAGVIANVTSAGIAQIQAIDFDPKEPGVCIAGKNGLGGLEVTFLAPNGTTRPVWDRVAVSGTEIVDVRSSPLDGSCWYLTDTSIGYVNPSTGALAENAATPPGRSLAVGPDGRAYYLDPAGDRIVRVNTSFAFTDFVDFAATDTYRNARSVAVDPVRGVVWIAVGPKPGDDSPPALLQLNPAGNRIGIVPASDPVHVIVNR